MTTWNKRLAQALAESEYNKNSLATELGVSAPTVSAWVGAAGIMPAKNITGENLLRVCQKLNVRPEWVMFKEGSMRPAEASALTESEQEWIGLIRCLTHEEKTVFRNSFRALARIRAGQPKQENRLEFNVDEKTDKKTATR